MGGGQRHSKNAGTMGCESLTYAERRALGFGTVRERLGKETVKDFDACGLCLTTAIDPVCTRKGHLYCKECVLNNLLEQKKDIARKLAAWEEQNKHEASDAGAAAAVAHVREIAAFDAQNHSAGAAGRGSAAGSEAGAGGDAAHGGASAAADGPTVSAIRAYWLPTKTPDAGPERVAKPDKHPKCPLGGDKLSLKDLVSVRFTPVAEADGTAYRDPISNDTFGPAAKLVVLAPTGDVVSEDSYTRFVKPDGMYEGHRIHERDVIHLDRGGTGFAAGGTQVESKTYKQLGIGSGLADRRGQNPSRSQFGLRHNQGGY